MLLWNGAGCTDIFRISSLLSLWNGIVGDGTAAALCSACLKFQSSSSMYSSSEVENVGVFQAFGFPNLNVCCWVVGKEGGGDEFFFDLIE